MPPMAPRERPDGADVLMVGSGLSIHQLTGLDTDPWTVVALNKAWQFAPDRFDWLIHSDGLAGSRRPEPGRFPPGRVLSHRQVRPLVEPYGDGLEPGDGDPYHRLTGQLIHLVATYWALARLAPWRIAYLGCDFDYDGTTSHYYGKGQAVFVRELGRPSLDRLLDHQWRLARRDGVELVNLSTAPRTRLPFPRLDPSPWTVAAPPAERAVAR